MAFFDFVHKLENLEIVALPGIFSIAFELEKKDLNHPKCGCSRCV